MPQKSAEVCILLGSPRVQGNTESLLRPLTEELTAAGHTCRTIRLYGRDLRPCTACRTCQKGLTGFGCPQPDEMQSIFTAVLRCDLLVLATPIYSWYCTPPMKAVLDRLVYGMNKIYEETHGPRLWQGKKAALVATCGYPPEKGADLWEAGFTRYCKHSGLSYLGMLSERHLGYDVPFMDAQKEADARAFARTLLSALAADDA